MSATILSVEGLSAAYGDITALHSVDLEVKKGSLVAVLGANGAGKTTLLRTLSGLHPAAAGRVRLENRDITRIGPQAVVAEGLVHVPEGRRVFAGQTVRDNLELGAWSRRRERGWLSELERVFALFPRLRERERQLAGTLSGGEQQMLAIGRALMARPRVLLLDEPSLGLAPVMIQQVAEALAALKASGLTILLVEQHTHVALRLADHAYVLRNGRVVASDRADVLAADPRLKDLYLAKQSTAAGDAVRAG